MNQKQAKRLRSIAYDGADKHEVTRYRKIIKKKGDKYVDTGAIRCIGNRRIYLDMKKKYKEEN